MHAQSRLTLYHPMNYISRFMGSSSPEYWSGLPFPPPGDLPNQGLSLLRLLSSCSGRWLLFHYHFFTWETPQSSAITALQGELVSPKGTREGKEYLPSSSRQTTATPYGGPGRSGRENTGCWPQIAEMHLKAIISMSEPRLLRLPIHRKALNSLTWGF